METKRNTPDLIDLTSNSGTEQWGPNLHSQNEAGKLLTPESESDSEGDRNRG